MLCAVVLDLFERVGLGLARRSRRHLASWSGSVCRPASSCAAASIAGVSCSTGSAVIVPSSMAVHSWWLVNGWESAQRSHCRPGQANAALAGLAPSRDPVTAGLSDIRGGSGSAYRRIDRETATSARCKRSGRPAHWIAGNENARGFQATGAQRSILMRRIMPERAGGIKSSCRDSASCSLARGKARIHRTFSAMSIPSRARAETRRGARATDFRPRPFRRVVVPGDPGACPGLDPG